ncbi:MAG: McrB family protein, partial [Synechocystis sp.]
PIFSPIHQKHFIEIFDKHFSASFHYENLLFTEYLKSLPEFSEFDSWQIKEFLYSEFPPDLSVFSLGLAYSRVDSYDVDVLEVINYHHPELTSVIKTVLGNNQDLFTIENKSNTLINSIKNSLLRVPNLILYGPPGTGKTYIAKAITDSIIADQVEKNRDNSIIFSPQTSHYSDYVAFHQSFSYEDFIEGLKPTIKDGIVTYSYVDGIFKEICKRAKGNPDNKYILIIDEINRANIAKIFGELITLLESDKRLGTQNELKVTLPYSKQSFGIPANLYIIGTMNTSDHSIALLDIALRRRFTFIEIMPNPELLKNSIIEDINLGQLMEVLNHKIRGLICRDYQIGHSYLMNIDNLEELEFRWYYQIVPLLQEYCYNNWQQLQLIIGSDFIKEDTIA